MIAKGSQSLRPASIGGLLRISGTCMKTITRSGQAWRGYHCARRGLGWIEALAGSTQAAAAARWRIVMSAHVQRGERDRLRTACGCGFLVGLWRKKNRPGGRSCSGIRRKIAIRLAYPGYMGRSGSLPHPASHSTPSCGSVMGSVHCAQRLCWLYLHHQTRQRSAE